MTMKEYYEIIKSEWGKVDKNNLSEIKRYNEYKRELRKMVQEA